MSTDLVSLIVKALHELDGQQTLKIPQDLKREMSLFGLDGILDSLGLVTLVVAVEQAIEDEWGVSLSLADDKALSQRNSPYRTVGSLAEYAGRLLQETKRDG